MKFKTLKTLSSAVVAASALASSFTPAFAGIDVTNNAELFLIVFDGTASYSKDTGIKLDTFLGASRLANTTASNFSMNVGPLYANFASTANLQWALLAVDAEGTGDPLDYRMLATGTNNVRPNFLDAGNLQNDVGSMSLAIGAMNQTCACGPVGSTHGETFNAKGTVAYYDDSILLAASTRTTNRIGVSSSVWLAVNPSYDSSEDTLMTKMAGTASFNGTSFGYTVTAVPEPQSLALLLAGLGVVGFVARRRHA